MQYAHIAAVNSAARSQRAVELSACDLAGDEEYPLEGTRGGRYKLVNGRKVYKPGDSASGSKKGGSKTSIAPKLSRRHREMREEHRKEAQRGDREHAQQARRVAEIKRELDPQKLSDMRPILQDKGANDWARVLGDHEGPGAEASKHHESDKRAASYLRATFGIPRGDEQMLGQIIDDLVKDSMEAGNGSQADIENNLRLLVKRRVPTRIKNEDATKVAKAIEWLARKL